MYKINRTITWKYMPLYEKINHLNTSIQNSKNVLDEYLNKLLSRDIVKKYCNELHLPIIRKIFDSVHCFFGRRYRG